MHPAKLGQTVSEEIGMVVLKLKKGDAVTLSGPARIEVNPTNPQQTVRIVIKAPKTTKVQREKGVKRELD